MFELFVGNDLARRRVQERIEASEPVGEPRAKRVRSVFGRAGSAISPGGLDSRRRAARSALRPASRGCN